MLSLWNRHAMLDPLTPALLREKVWGDADVTSDFTWLAEEHGRLLGFSIGVARRRKPHPIGYVKLLVVDAARRRQGIGSQLLQATERALLGAGVGEIRMCESAPNYLTPGVDQRYVAGKRFVEAHGYACVGAACNLTVDLTQNNFAAAAPEARLASRGVTVRRATANDAKAVLTVVAAHWPAWRAEVTHALRNDPMSLHLALAPERILGFAAYDTNNLGMGWFGPMGTVPAAEGQGVGRVLLRRCLQDQKAQGRAAAIIPWVGPVDFYRRCAGAQVARRFDRYAKRMDKFQQV